MNFQSEALATARQRGVIPIRLFHLPLIIFLTGALTWGVHAEQIFVRPSQNDVRISLPASQQKSVKRARMAVLDTNASWFATGSGNLLAPSTVFNLFEDVTVTGILENATSPGPGRMIYRGHLQGEAGSYFLLASQSNVVAGTVFLPKRGGFKIQYAGDGIHRISETDPKLVPPCGVTKAAGKEVPLAFQAAPAAKLSTASSSLAGTTLTVVDVLVLYTAQARDGAGGDSGMDTLIDLAVAEANTVYQNSKVNLLLHLAKKAKVSYEGSGNLTTDLNRLVNQADGYLDEVAGLRKSCQADLVCLLVENSDGPSGIAVQTANATNAFSVVERQYAVGNYIFAHELAHNFGCQHDRSNANTSGVYSYSYGWVFPVGYSSYGTVMSYPGQRIPYFSNPLVNFLGVPTGIASGANAANNAQTLSLRMPTVSAFSGIASTTQTPTITLTSPTNNTSIFVGSDLVLTANAAAGTGAITRVDFFRDGALMGSSTGPVFQWALTNIPFGDFTFTASAANNLGASTDSLPVTLHARFGNDSFAYRQAFSGTNLVVGVQNYGATLQAGEPMAFDQGDATVWFTWTAPLTGSVLFSLPSHDYSAFAAVYTGNVLTNLTFISGSAFGAPAFFQAVQGKSYQIAIGGYDYSTISGNATLAWQEFPAPSSDDFDSAITIAGATFHAWANNVTATSEPGEPSHGGYAAGHSVWWQWTAPANGQVQISAAGQAVIVAVYVGETISNLTSVVASNPSVGLNVQPGQTYRIAVDSTDGEYASFNLDLMFTPGAPPPANDNFADAVPLAGNNLIFNGSTVGATRELGEPESPGHYNAGSGCSVWWSWTAPFAGQLSIGAGRNDASVGVYTGSQVDKLTRFASSLGGATITVTAGITYHIMLDSVNAPFTTALELKLVPSITDLSNDNFSNRMALVGTSVAIVESNAGATKEPGEPNHGNIAGGQSVWFSWTPTFSGMVQIRVDGGGQSFYPLLGVYRGTNLTSLVALGEAAFSSPYYSAPQLTLVVTNGMPLQIAVDGYNGFYGQIGAVGQFVLNIASPPANDNFSERQTIAGTNIRLKSSNFMATKEWGEPNHGFNPGGSSVWFSWTAPADGSAVFNIDSSFGPLTGIYTGLALTNLVPILSSASRTLNFDVVAGKSYQLAVDSQSGSGGAFTINLLLGPQAARPPNDNFTNRTAITGLGEIHSSNTNATREYGEPDHAGLGGNKSVWWEVAAPTTGRITVDPTGGGVNTVVVYSGTQLTNLSALASSPIFPGRPVSFDAVAGQQYAIVVDAFEGNGGAGYGVIDLQFSIELAPPNDSFSNRIILTGTNGLISVNNTGASRESGEPIHGAYGSHSVWYAWTAPATGSLLLQTTAFNLSPLTAVYTGTKLNNLAPVDNASGRFAVVSGQTYLIAADTYADQYGTFTLALDFTPTPVNDNFSQRLPLAGNFIHLAASNIGATREAGEAGDFFPGSAIACTNSIWWTWQAQTTGTLTVRGSASSSAFLSLYTGSSIGTLNAVPRTIDWWTGLTSFNVSAGTTYQISLDGFWQTALADYFWWTAGPPPNDAFANRELIGGVTNLVFGFNSYATSEINEPNPLGAAAGKSIWYAWTAPLSARYLVSADLSDFGGQSVIEVYAGASLTNLNFIAGAAAPGTASFRAVAGVSYAIAIDTLSTQAVGLARLTLRPLPPNDMFEDRLPLSGTNFTVSGSNAEATLESGELVFGRGHTLWWSWNAPMDGRTTLAINSEDTALRVYTGNSVSNLTAIADQPGNVSFTAHGGTTYQFVVDTSFSTRTYSFTLNQFPAPLNDAFAHAIPIAGLPRVNASGLNTGATVEPGEPRFADPNCTDTVWWKWTAPETRQMTINTSGQTTDWFASGFAGVFAIFTGNSVSNLILVAQGTNQGSFSAVTGITYFIAMDGAGGSLGNLSLNLVPTAANDDFTNRQSISGYSLALSGSSAGATMEPGEMEHAIDPCGSSIWFTWKAPASGDVTITYSGDGFWPAVAVYTGSALSNLVGVAGNNFNHPVTFTAFAGTVYQMAYAGWYGGNGNYTFNLWLNAAKANDNFSNRIFLNGTNLIVAANNTGATKQTGEPNVGGNVPSHSLWWSYKSPADGSLRIDFSSLGFTPLVGIYTGSTITALKAVTNITDYVRHQTVFNTLAGTNYQISIDGFNQAVGDIQLQLDFQPLPSNDKFTNRLVLTGSDFATNANNRGATEEPGENRHAGLTGNHSLWWSWTAPTSELVSLTVSGVGFSPHLAVYRGSTFTSLTLVTSNYIGNVLVDNISFTTQAGTNYQIAVDSTFVDFGDISLNLAPTPRPPNDDFTNAIPLTGFALSTAGSNLAATKQAGEPSHAGQLANHSIWWTWIPGISGPVSLDTIGSSFDTVVAVYTGINLTNLAMVASNDDVANGGSASQLDFDAVAGTAYKIAVDGFAGAGGDVQLNLTANTPPPLQIGDARISPAGQFGFSVYGMPTELFLLQTSTNLTTWNSFSTNQFTNPQFDYTQPTNLNSTMRFYRLVPWP